MLSVIFSVSDHVLCAVHLATMCILLESIAGSRSVHTLLDNKVIFYISYPHLAFIQSNILLCLAFIPTKSWNKKFIWVLEAFVHSTSSYVLWDFSLVYQGSLGFYFCPSVWFLYLQGCTLIFSLKSLMKILKSLTPLKYFTLHSLLVWQCMTMNKLSLDVACSAVLLLLCSSSS